MELGADESLPIAEMWDEECLWKIWVDPESHHEGIFPDDCGVIKDSGDRWKHRLVYWKRRFWMFYLESAGDEGPEIWIADPFRDSVSEKAAQLCVEADVLLSVAVSQADVPLA